MVRAIGGIGDLGNLDEDGAHGMRLVTFGTLDENDAMGEVGG